MLQPLYWAQRHPKNHSAGRFYRLTENIGGGGRLNRRYLQTAVSADCHIDPSACPS
jgi:hypothetical protein